MDLVTVVLHILHLLCEHTLLLSVEILDSHGTVLAFKHLYVDVVKTQFDLADGFLHDLDHLEGAVHMFFGLSNEICDFLGLPLELI